MGVFVNALNIMFEPENPPTLSLDPKANDDCADAVLRERIPGTVGQPHTTIEGGGHFLQEDRGPELAEVVAAFVATTP